MEKLFVNYFKAFSEELELKIDKKIFCYMAKMDLEKAQYMR
jgi:hypothetical protein